MRFRLVAKSMTLNCYISSNFCGILL